MGVEHFNLYRTHKPHGCKICKHNPMGICEMCGKEVPMRLVIQNGIPSWCPKKGGKNDNYRATPGVGKGRKGNR